MGLPAPAALGAHTIVAGADSFGTRSFDVTIVDGIDRITVDADAWSPHVGDSATVCFHAHRGDLRSTPFQTVLIGHVNVDAAPSINTATSARRGGRYEVRATAFGVSATFAVDVTLGVGV